MMMGSGMDCDDELHFCWDDRKAAANLEKHGVSFETATYVFDDRNRLEQEDGFSEGEYRNLVIGWADDALLTVVYSCPEEDLYRIISARPPLPMSAKTYERNIFHP
ncbi:MAG TPA: BrnT family toxin [Steroidobacteraceae bacterium]|nr:BrnT family toxin [Steroidobacteraceae bacterium]